MFASVACSQQQAPGSNPVWHTTLKSLSGAEVLQLVSAFILVLNLTSNIM